MILYERTDVIMLQLNFYEWLIIAMLFIIVSTLICTVFLKFIYDVQAKQKKLLKIVFSNEIENVIDCHGKYGFETELDIFAISYNKLVYKRRYNFIIEEILFEIIEGGGDKSHAARKIAYKLNFPQKSIKNLKKSSPFWILLGCIQCKLYLYKPATHYLLEHLKDNDLSLQYDILLALARFNDPELIIAALNNSNNSLVVNERTIRNIIKFMTPPNQEILMVKILEINSDSLSALFLKCLEKESATALKDRIIPLTDNDNSQELRIASIKAISVMENPDLVPHLISGLLDSDWEMRAVSAKSLESLPDTRTLYPLLNAICDEKWWVRQNAALALLSFPNPEIAIQKVVDTKDQYAYESLYYAAETKNMTVLINEFPDIIRHIYNKYSTYDSVQNVDSPTIEVSAHKNVFLSTP